MCMKRITSKKSSARPILLPAKIFLGKQKVYFDSKRDAFALLRKIRREKHVLRVIEHLERHSQISSKESGFHYVAFQLHSKRSATMRVLEFGSAGRGFLSTVFFDWIVTNLRNERKVNGDVISIDISSRPKRKFSRLLKRTDFVVTDAFEWIKNYTGPKFDLIYYDSKDIDFAHPGPSMNHHFELFQSSIKFAEKDAILFFDDTPLNESYAQSKVDYEKILRAKEEFGFVPGKGRLALEELQKLNLGRIVFWEYAAVVKLGEYEDLDPRE